MQQYLDEIESWMEQVRDDDLGVEDYDFLDRLVHGGSKNNGNNGLANVGAYLAIYEEDGEVVLDEELVDELDRRQAGNHYGGERISNIVYNPKTQKRDDNTLFDKAKDDDSSFNGGHERLSQMLEAFKEEADYEEVSPPDNHSPNKDNDSSTNMVNSTENHLTNQEGGDNAMGLIQEIGDRAVEYAEDGADAAEAAEQAINDYDDRLNEAEMYISDIKSTVRDELERVQDEGIDLAHAVGRMEATIENSDADDTMDSIESMYDDLVN